jgi:hypothetical protein
LPNGKSSEVRHHAGDVIWSPAHTHALENLSDQPIRVIEYELKPQPQITRGSHVQPRTAGQAGAPTGPKKANSKP